MRLKVLSLFVLIVAFKPGCAFAQTAPLISTPVSQQVPIVVKKRSIFLDIPILPMRETIHVTRLRDGGLNYGPILDPWGKNVVYRINLAPEITVSSADNRLHVAGGFAQAYDEGRKRNDSFFDIAVDRQVWKFSAGAASFIEGESVNDVFEIVDITADFSRLSMGAKMWGGVKAGSFSDNFFTMNIGGGYVETRGDMRYHHPVLKNIDPAQLYKDNFITYIITAEGRKVYPRITAHLKVEGGGYSGDNTFHDLSFQGAIEVLPLKRFSSARVLVRGNSHFKKYDSLLFRTDDPDIQFYLRFKIK